MELEYFISYIICIWIMCIWSIFGLIWMFLYCYKNKEPIADNNINTFTGSTIFIGGPVWWALYLIYLFSVIKIEPPDNILPKKKK